MGPINAYRNAKLLFKKQPALSTTEIIQVLITVILGGFYVSFNMWGVDELDYVYGIQNLITITLAFFLILTLIIIVQKFVGFMLGYKATYEYSWLGLLIGFFVTFMTNGIVPFFLPGGNSYKPILSARLGKYRRDHKHAEIFMIASIATIIPIIFTLLFSSIYLATDEQLFRNLVIAGLFMAFFSLIPLPHMLSPHKWGMHGPSDIKILDKFSNGTYGFDMLLSSLTAYAFLAATTIMFILLAITFNIFSLVISFLLAIVVLIVYKIVITYFTK